MRWMVCGVLLALFVGLVLRPSQATEPDSPELALRRPLLSKDDFEYLGAFTLPKTVLKHSTAYGEAGMAMRKFNGKWRFITATHRYSGDALYECEFPGFAKPPQQYPEAKLVKEWGTEIYGQSRIVKEKLDPKTKMLETETGLVEGITYDERTNRLYWNFGSWYNIPPTNGNAMGFAVLKDDEVAVTGTGWKSPDGHAAHNQKIRGGTLIIPDWFASSYLDGRRLGLGFGGYYSGVAACSKGPFLAAAREPAQGSNGGTLDLVTLIDHPDRHWGLRDPDYRSEIDWAPNPRGKVGYWGAMDETFGAGVWIDLPDKHGVLIASNMGHGRIWYDNSDRLFDRIEAWWWVYDPAQLAEVARRKRNPWDCEPKSWKVDYTPRPHRIKTSALLFDPQSRTLFVVCPFSLFGGVEFFTLVHGYRIKQ